MTRFMCGSHRLNSRERIAGQGANVPADASNTKRPLGRPPGRTCISGQLERIQGTGGRGIKVWRSTDLTGRQRSKGQVGDVLRSRIGSGRRFGPNPGSVRRYRWGLVRTINALWRPPSSYLRGARHCLSLHVCRVARNVREVRDPKSEEGQSLIEMVVAMGLLAAVIALFAQAFMAGTFSSGYAQVKEVAVTLADSAIDNARAVTPSLVSVERHLCDHSSGAGRSERNLLLNSFFSGGISTVAKDNDA